MKVHEFRNSQLKQKEEIFQSVPVTANYSCRFLLRQTLELPCKTYVTNFGVIDVGPEEPVKIVF